MFSRRRPAATDGGGSTAGFSRRSSDRRCLFPLWYRVMSLNYMDFDSNLESKFDF